MKSLNTNKATVLKTTVNYTIYKKGNGSRFARCNFTGKFVKLAVALNDVVVLLDAQKNMGKVVSTIAFNQLSVINSQAKTMMTKTFSFRLMMIACIAVILSLYAFLINDNNYEAPIKTDNTTIVKSTIVQEKINNTQVTANKKIYIVKSGDTLSSIAQAHYKQASKYKTLAQYNNIKDVNKIKINQTIHFN